MNNGERRAASGITTNDINRKFIIWDQFTIGMGGCAKEDKGKEGKEDGGGQQQFKAGRDTAFQRVLALTEDFPQFDISSENYLFRVKMTGSEAGRPAEPKILDEHLSYLANMVSHGKIDSYGVIADYSKEVGYKVIVAKNKEEAKEINEQDPLVRAGYYSKYEIEKV